MSESASVDIEATEQMMLDDAYRASQATSQAQAEPAAELNVSRIVRPHLSHTPEVSGLLVPIAEAYRDRIEGNWLLYRQWADGKREAVDLMGYLDVDGGERIWFNPEPPTHG